MKMFEFKIGIAPLICGRTLLQQAQIFICKHLKAMMILFLIMGHHDLPGWGRLALHGADASLNSLSDSGQTSA